MSVDDREDAEVGKLLADDKLNSRSNSNNESGSIADSAKDYEPSIDSLITSKGNPVTEEPKAAAPSLAKERTRFFSPKLKDHRKKVFIQFAMTNLVLFIFILIIFDLFWGSTYQTTSHYNKVRILALIQDDQLDSDSTVTQMTPMLEELIAELPGQWHLYNTTSFAEKYGVNTTEEINEKVIKLIYDEKFFLSFNVLPNVTQSLYQSLTVPNATYWSSTDFFKSYYESGRDPTGIKPFMLPLITTLESYFKSYYISTYLPSFLSNITSSNTYNTTNIANAGSFNFEYVDNRPFYDRIFYSCTQIGVIYTLVLTVFQFLIMGPVHGQMAGLLKPKYMCLYRITVTWCTCFILSLFVCTISAIYHVNFTLAFGRGGFMIYWMSTWLFMMAVAGANENVISILFAWKPQYTGLWILGFVILNIAPTFFTMALDSNFYRYGYMMPLHNIVDIYRTLFLDLSRYKMGRNYGILVAWIALNTACMPVAMKCIQLIVAHKTKAALKEKRKQDK
ncbi:hypothetical protein KAFR_0C06275 [Kazachstania africana CBS 2517]|uniref:DUF3533 domain-containing protein n=1 Tax=Kazachstania africana (strain ATCC 22294 / BCRC 22015 / CBS 2517 / CECT 1963 / NBRC 1671 / NRRL Y-8276) TaxID=1071382 RepID=H2ATC3_KAZAF|nr:hypothetical protein KAFR_0C06275 [Kazachstania africana CBS 2517]CCF57623.1 hypothetical protein KAFR_0C06275 [Kazachstania africana CBS 2517]